MKRKPLLQRVRGAAQFATVGTALALCACSDGKSTVVAGAGEAAGGAAASGGLSSAIGGAGASGRDGLDHAGTLGAGLAGAGGASLHAGGSSAAGSSAAGSSASAGSGASLSLLGSDCENDAQCGTGLTCLPSSTTELDGGGPAHGLCTLLCTANSQCTALEAGAGCFSFGDNGYCLQACTLGDPADLDSKCHGRPDFVCAPVDSESFCLPMCRADAECGANRFCNRGTGLCVNSKPVGDPVGTACDPTATTPTCLAVCLRTSEDGVTPATGVCAEACSGASGCMFDNAGTKPGGVCFGPLTDPFGVFDLGYCSPSCTCSGDCPAFGNKCRAWTTDEADYKDYLGKAGLCYHSTEGSSELVCK